jgi:hypothetical protein
VAKGDVTDVTGRRNGVVARLLLALALLAGLLGMHALAPPSAMPAHGAEHSAPPPGEHGHPGPVCESGAPVGPLWTAHVDAGVVATDAAEPAPPVSHPAVTAAGSGCDPPDRAQLQVWRT